MFSIYSSLCANKLKASHIKEFTEYATECRAVRALYGDQLQESENDGFLQIFCQTISPLIAESRKLKARVWLFALNFQL